MSIKELLRPDKPKVTILILLIIISYFVPLFKMPRVSSEIATIIVNSLIVLIILYIISIILVKIYTKIKG